MICATPNWNYCCFFHKKCDNSHNNCREGFAVNNLRKYLKRFADAMGDVFVYILAGLVLMALGSLLSLIG